MRPFTGTKLIIKISVPFALMLALGAALIGYAHFMLSRQSEHLAAEVGRFLTTVRAA